LSGVDLQKPEAVEETGLAGRGKMRFELQGCGRGRSTSRKKATKYFEVMSDANAQAMAQRFVVILAAAASVNGIMWRAILGRRKLFHMGYSRVQFCRVGFERIIDSAGVVKRKNSACMNLSR